MGFSNTNSNGNGNSSGDFTLQAASIVLQIAPDEG